MASANPKENELSPGLIAQEMREASRGSFPLSPGTMDGHYAVSRLYWHYRQDTLTHATVSSVFGIQNPDPPVLRLPAGHQHFSIDGLNRSVWKDVLQTAFVTKPKVDFESDVQLLLSKNAASDVTNFSKRLRGEKAQIATPDTRLTPSLVRGFLYENKFPEKNEFFSWLFDQMRREVASASKEGFNESWSKSLGTLVDTWNKHFQDNPFIPSE